MLQKVNPCSSEPLSPHPPNNRTNAGGSLTAGCVVPPSSDSDALRLACAGIVLQPAAGCVLSTTIDAGIQQAVLVEEGRVDFTVTLGEASQRAGDKAAELLGLGESLHLGASWAAVATAHLAESVPLHPALCKLADAGSWQAQG